MKQISRKAAEALALKNAARGALAREEEFFASQWLKENARHVAAIETGRVDKTFFGEFPKGWRAAMKADAKTKAREYIVESFIREKCASIDDALWLNDWQLIEANPGRLA